jgi:hypothetical protein
MLKEKIKLTGNNISINFGISNEDNFLGLQQEIDNHVEVVSVDLINPALDLEERRFKFPPATEYMTLSFDFYYQPTNIYVNSFLFAGFTNNNINSKSDSFLNSFFILDYYDTFDENTQTKIFTTYLTKLGSVPKYTISPLNQLFSLYVPISYTNVQTGSTVTGYSKLSFYNASYNSNNNVVLFYNDENANLTTPEKMYFKTVLNLTDNTWSFVTTTLHPNFIAKQLITSTAYIQKTNDAVANYNNQQQNYPAGVNFNYKTGKYENFS